jgi:alpha-tubulin suppressor-like RCC1 family protein
VAVVLPYCQPSYDPVGGPKLRVLVGRVGRGLIVVVLVLAAVSVSGSGPVAAFTVVRGPSITAGFSHSLALRSDGTVWAFGSNLYGQLGTSAEIGTFHGNPTPTLVPGLSGVTAVAAGGGHSLALRSDGTVWAFGRDPSSPTNPAPALAPALVPGLTGVTAVAAGGAHSLALRSDGTVWAFGSNFYGELGTSTNSGTNPTPAQVPGLTGVTAVAAGSTHSLALRSDGTVWAFGSNLYGELGTSTNSGTGNPTPTPTLVPGLTGVTVVAAGGLHSLALRSDGTVWAFGNNIYSQLGTSTNSGTFNPNPTPVQVPGPTGVAAVSAGGVHSLALRSDGTVWAFGNNVYGQSGSTTNNRTYAANPVAVTSAVVPVVASRFVAVTPTRVLDTRSLSAVNYTGGKPGAQSLTKVTVVGAGGVPVGATAITANLTGTEATAPGFVQVFPTGAGTPGASSNLNVERGGQTIANAVTVPIGVDGSITVHSQSGVHLLLDVTGYFTAAVGPTTGGRLIPVVPTRIFDTRRGSSVNYTGAKPVADSITRVQATGRSPIPSTGVAAVVLNVTATEATAKGFIQVGPAGSLTRGASSNLNIETVGQTIANQVIVPVGAGGAIAVYSQSGAHLIVDVTGYITDDTVAAGTDGLFVPATPIRVLDTRPGTLNGYSGPFPGAGSSVRVDTNNKGGVPSSGVTAVAANITVTEATKAGFVQAAASGTLVPGASSVLKVNTIGRTIANAAVVPVTNGRFDLYTQSGAHLLTDIFGWYTN